MHPYQIGIYTIKDVLRQKNVMDLYLKKLLNKLLGSHDEVTYKGYLITTPI